MIVNSGVGRQQFFDTPVLRFKRQSRQALEEQIQLGRVLARELDVGEPDLDEPLVHGQRLRHGEQVRREVVDVLRGEREEDLVLAVGEVAVEGRSREVHAAGELPHRQLARALLRDQVARGGENLVPGLLMTLVLTGSR